MASFEFEKEFKEFLPKNGVQSIDNYVQSGMSRASVWLGRSLGPAELYDRDSVEKLLVEILQINPSINGKPYSENAKEQRNQRSRLRKYAQMVESNYLGLFSSFLVEASPAANDFAECPARVEQITYRHIRDTQISREIKRLYDFTCQICGIRLEIQPGKYYAEAHHIQPLGNNHNGHDIKENLLCLCPNHHALFDYFAIPFDPKTLKNKKHNLGDSYVAYHNEKVKGATNRG